MSNYNIGPRIGIEGEAEFRKQISRINSEYKSMSSYVQSVSKTMEQSGKTQEGLKAKMNGLNQQIKLQEQKYKALEGALAKVREKFGENSAEAMRYEGALLDINNVTTQLKRELSDTGQELWRLSEGIEDVAEEAGEASDEVLSFGDVLKAGLASGAILDAVEEIGEAVLEIGEQAIEAAAEVKAANSQFSQTFGNLEETARSALESVADDTGIAVTRMQDGYTSLYAFSKSVGADSETALSIAQRAMIAAADSAAYYDKSMEDATETLQSFLKGNYENDAALGIAATETTRNAKANEMYAMSFKELSEAQKVDVLLAMVEAGNAASGALGQAAREADSWTNVTGEAAESWRQLLAVLGSPVLEALIPVIQGVTEGMQALIATTKADELRAAMEDYEQTLASANAALAETRQETETNAILAGRYVSRLEALEKAGLNTAEAQEEYAATVELLNELLPGLNLAIDEQTGLVNKSSAAILGNAEAMKQQAMYQQRAENYNALIQQQAASEIKLQDAKKRLIELEEQEAALIDQGADANRVYATTLQMVGGELVAVNGVYTENDEALAANQAEQAHLQAQIDETTAAMAEQEAELKRQEDALNGYGEATAYGAEQTSLVAQTIAQTQTRLDELSSEYEKARLSAMESINSQVGLFQELEAESEYSAKSIVENWGKQQEAFVNYADNLQKAVDMGLDEALVAQLSDGSQQSMQILNEFVNGTEVGVDELNAAFRDRLEAEVYLADTMGKIEADVDGTMAEIVDDAKRGGVEVVNGVAQAISNYTYLFERAMRQMGKKGVAAFNQTMEIRSPSRVMAEAGDYTVDGLVNQIQRRTADLERTMAQMATAGTTALERQLAAAEAFPHDYGVPASGATTNNHSVAYGGISININTQPGQDERAIADAVVQEITARFGREGGSF